MTRACATGSPSIVIHAYPVRKSRCESFYSPLRITGMGCGCLLGERAWFAGALAVGKSLSQPVCGCHGQKKVEFGGRLHCEFFLWPFALL